MVTDEIKIRHLVVLIFGYKKTTAITFDAPSAPSNNEKSQSRYKSRIQILHSDLSLTKTLVQRFSSRRQVPVHSKQQTK